ncbi:UDP-glucose 4-epimerase [candidate division Kazan bacterium]|uniref:UDP-glucose 4-epimerase n=1 Tax=candidate division Kazan bacterium TaxID=2202143 RepID=A0A420ZC22_UNCK3|nr:MAG: UDP-glucose 4-epimerase [candidate division Kazan bacterium]
MKILVTGGAGFIGSHIVDAYINNGHEVIVVDNLSSGYRQNINKRAKFYQADVNNYWEIEEIFLVEKPDIVSHHAGQISINVSVKNPIYDATVNILGTINLLEVSVRYGVDKFIFSSSGGAIYDERYIPSRENSPTKPQSPYGIAKLSIERYMEYYRNIRGLKTVILRYSNVYGPRQDSKGENAVIPIFINKLKSNQAPIIFGSGKQTRDFINVADVVNANMLVSAINFTGTLNISSGRETTIIELFNIIRSAINIPLQPQFQPARPGEQLRSCLDNTLARTSLGWKPTINLSEGIDQLVQHPKINTAPKS